MKTACWACKPFRQRGSWRQSTCARSLAILTWCEPHWKTVLDWSALQSVWGSRRSMKDRQPKPWDAQHVNPDNSDLMGGTQPSHARSCLTTHCLAFSWHVTPAVTWHKVIGQGSVRLYSSKLALTVEWRVILATRYDTSLPICSKWSGGHYFLFFIIHTLAKRLRELVDLFQPFQGVLNGHCS